MISRTLIALLGLTLLLPLNAANALGITVDNSEYRKKVLQYLASDFFITEGVGLNKVFIGQSQSSLVEKMGAPLKKKKQGLFTGLVVYSYTLDSETAMQVGLKRGRVQSIAFAGTLSSQYATMKGARFAMPYYEIVNYYGGGAIKNNKLLFRSRGIRFDFKDNKLSIIRIFPKQ